jgi:outer membrane immunogenic protein
MKSILTAAALIALGTVSASAADLAARPYTKAPMMAPTWDWSGFYIGGNVGYGISRSPTDSTLIAPTTPPTVVLGTSSPLSSDGVVGGGQIGWNKMFAPSWLFGIEADIQGADQKGTSTTRLDFLAPGQFASVESRLNWFGTVRARLGWTATPDTLLYVTGGYAYGEVETRNSSNLSLFGLPVPAGSSAKSVKDGWTVGGGVETRLWNSNWTAKAEYLYIDLGSQGTANLVGPAPNVSQVSNVDFKDHVVRVGLNYKLGGWGY